MPLGKFRMNMLEARYELLTHATRKPSIIMLGGSITAGVPWTEVAECPGVASYGFNGNSSASVLYRLREFFCCSRAPSS